MPANTAPVVLKKEREIQLNRFNARLNDIRMSPLKQLPMTLLMMFLVGNDVGIFSIMFVGMAVIGPLQSIFSVNKNFAELATESEQDPQMRSAVLQSKAIFVGCCAVALVVALVKLNWMGLLPVNAVDWMSSTPPAYKETSWGSYVS